MENHTSLHKNYDKYHSHGTSNNKKPIVLFTGAEEQASMDTYRLALNTLALSRGERIFLGKGHNNDPDRLFEIH